MVHVYTAKYLVLSQSVGMRSGWISIQTCAEVYSLSAAAAQTTFLHLICITTRQDLLVNVWNCCTKHRTHSQFLFKTNSILATVTGPLSCPSCLSVCNVGVFWPNGWMDQDATWYRGGPRLRSHCVRWGTQLPHRKGHSSPHFSAHVYCGQTVAHLSNC